MNIYSPVLNPCPFTSKKLFAMYGTATNTIKNDISIFPVYLLLMLILINFCFDFFLLLLHLVDISTLRTINSHICMSSYFTILLLLLRACVCFCAYCSECFDNNAHWFKNNFICIYFIFCHCCYKGHTQCSLIKPKMMHARTHSNDRRANTKKTHTQIGNADFSFLSIDGRFCAMMIVNVFVCWVRSVFGGVAHSHSCFFI